MRFAIFPLHLSKYCACHRKIDARSYEGLHLSRKIILANLQIGCSKMQFTLHGWLWWRAWVWRAPRDFAWQVWHHTNSGGARQTQARHQSQPKRLHPPCSFTFWILHDFLSLLFTGLLIVTPLHIADCTGSAARKER